MESAETISAVPAPLKSSRRISVFPEAVGPKRIMVWGNAVFSVSAAPGAGDPPLLRADPEFYLAGKNLPRGKGYDLVVIFLDLRLLQHGKLIGTPGRGDGKSVHIAVIFDEFLQRKYHTQKYTHYAK
jgi:hypothetical protein